MQIEISLDKDIREIDAFFDELKFKAVTLAARQAINRTGRDLRTLSIKEIRKRRKLKLKDLKGGTKGKGNVTFRKATGTNLAFLEGLLSFSGRPLPLILFILGQKVPKRQTLPNRRRKSRRFEIRPGDKKAKRGLFIQKAKRGSQRFQVFRRKDPSDSSKGFVMQSVPSVAQFLTSKMNILRKIENSGIAIMQREYDKALKFQLDKLKF